MNVLPETTDYQLFLKEQGITEEQIRAYVENEYDLVEYPNQVSLEIKESEVEGFGVFATAQFNHGDFIANASVKDNRTPSGRFTNHSNTPNAIPVIIDNEICHVAIKKINQGEEVLINYRDDVVTRSELTPYNSLLLSLIPEGSISKSEYRGWIESIENKMKDNPLSIDRHNVYEGIKLKHTFTQGLYTREIFMPAGALVVSRIHLFEHPFVISKGSVSVYDGDKIINIEAPYQGVTPSGTKRILYVHQDTVWTTFHVTDKDRFEDIDKDGVITCESFDEYEKIAHKEVSI